MRDFFTSLFVPGSAAAILLFAIGTSSAAETVERKFCRSYPGDKTIEWECLRLQKGDTLETLFGEKWREIARFNRIDRRHIRKGTTLKSPKNAEDLRTFSPMPDRFEPAGKEGKFILVDLSKQYLGAYEKGKLVFSLPAASGKKANKSPIGKFRISAYNSRHRSSVYYVGDTDELYPMFYGLRFHVDGDGISYWFHGRDLPGYPASHGCIGLSDEEMQKEVYGAPKTPELMDARKLFEWAIAPAKDDRKFHGIQNGPAVWVMDSLK